MLQAEGLRLSFSGVHALQGAEITAAEGSITALIGPNGAGKTTAFNCISRIQHLDAGSIRLDGEDLLARGPADLVELGVARTFQHVSLFGSLDVRDNLRVGEHAGRRRRHDRDGARTAWSTEDLVGLLGLGDDLSRDVATLPLGTQKRVELARALAAAPRLLMLDEPAGGLPHEEVMAMRDLLRDLNQQLHVTVLVVEHHMEMVMSLSDHVVVMATGRTIAAGPPAVVRDDAEVGRVYLGA
jgi:branched-chain amino acid transport system ATP-binding protein